MSLLMTIDMPLSGAATTLVIALVVVVCLAAVTRHMRQRKFFGTQQVDKASQFYASNFQEGKDSERIANAAEMTKTYYDLATTFYLLGWSKMFHFGRRFLGEAFEASLQRQEYWLAHQGGFTRGQRILDIGCGCGEPMRNIARFTGAKIIGININAYQIEEGRKLTEEAGLTHLCEFKQTDFMALEVEPNSMDGAFAIEATCHAPDKTKCFAQIYKALKPGAVFVGYEWCMTGEYDAKNREHQAIKLGIMEGDSLPDIAHTSEVVKSLKDAGFEVVESFDLATHELKANNVPWYSTLEVVISKPSSFLHSRLGVWLTHVCVWILELFCSCLVPSIRGITKTHSILMKAPPNLVKGGKQKIFTPMFFFHAVKPNS
jgi:sterol 24-C-methyltransferase